MRDWLIHLRRGEYASLQTQIREALVSAILDRNLDQAEPIPSIGPPQQFSSTKRRIYSAAVAKTSSLESAVTAKAAAFF